MCSSGICRTGLLTAHNSQSCQQTCTTYTTVVCTSEKLLMMDRGNCLKHVEYYSKNKFEKLVHIVGFVIRIFSVFCDWWIT